MRAFVFVFIALFVLTTPHTYGQTAPEPENPWQQSVAELATSLTGSTPAAVAPILQNVPLRAFNSSDRSKIVDLVDLCSSCVVISARGYVGLPMHVADDIAEDFAASDLPEFIKEKFALPDPVAARNANKIADQWVNDVLMDAKPDTVGMIVLWRGNQILPSIDNSYARDLIFILIAGHAAADGTFQFRQIVFGNPLVAAE
ncbi:MAG: hypothetical protein IT448_06310 [Phycisphaerales bacterium]|nr:hypothetical protein [Phycisphaerales bacterium]